jgi:hypothetical protein
MGWREMTVEAALPVLVALLICLSCMLVQVSINVRNNAQNRYMCEVRNVEQWHAHAHLIRVLQFHRCGAVLRLLVLISRWHDVVTFTLWGCGVGARLLDMLDAEN